jgi:hypothetical protein
VGVLVIVGVGEGQLSIVNWQLAIGNVGVGVAGAGDEVGVGGWRLEIGGWVVGGVVVGSGWRPQAVARSVSRQRRVRWWKGFDVVRWRFRVGMVLD